MAEIIATDMTGSGSRAVTVTTLGASDTFTYVKGQVLVINNITVGAITPNFDGANGTTVPVNGVGSIDVSGGYTTPSIAAGAYAAIPLDTIAKYLQGVVTVTGGDGAEVSLLSR